MQRIITISVLLSIVSVCLIQLPRAIGQDPMDPHPAVAPAIKQINATIEAGPFSPNWDSLGQFEIPQWYKDAKFGIFVHWGVYSVPAFGGEWYPRQMYIDTDRRGDNFFEHHVKTYGPQSKRQMVQCFRGRQGLRERRD